MFRRLAPAAAWVCAALLLAPIAAPAQDSAEPATPAKPTLSRIAICEDVQERAPVGESEQFSSEVGRLWCFTRVVGAENPTRIFHRWYVGNTLVDEIPITVKGSAWRCWSNKGIQANWNGPCRVEILTEAGDVLGSQNFVLTRTSDETRDG